MTKVNTTASFAYAREPDYRVTQLGNGAIIRDTLDDIGGQEAIQLKVDAYFSQKGLDLLIQHLQDLKGRLVTNGY